MYADVIDSQAFMSLALTGGKFFSSPRRSPGLRRALQATPRRDGGETPARRQFADVCTLPAPSDDHWGIMDKIVLPINLSR